VVGLMIYKFQPGDILYETQGDFRGTVIRVIETPETNMKIKGFYLLEQISDNMRFSWMQDTTETECVKINSKLARLFYL
jgi:hypothetical protein